MRSERSEERERSERRGLCCICCSQSEQQIQQKPRNVGTPNIAGLYSLAGFDRLFRRHGVRGLIDFPYPCRTVTTQVLLYGERISCVQRPHNYLGQCRTTAELSSDGVPPETVTSGY